MRFDDLDGRLALVLDDAHLAELLRACRRSERVETGGVLIGRYNERRSEALVTQVTGAPPDSRATRSSFLRGVRGLQRRLDQAWRRRTFYLGEWHFHPNGSAAPSGQDRKQIADFLKDPSYNCPEPILLVLGGDPDGEWHVTASLYRRGEWTTLATQQGEPPISLS